MPDHPADVAWTVATDTELAAVEQSPGVGPYGVEIRVDAYDDRSYDYWVFGRRFEPSGEGQSGS